MMKEDSISWKGKSIAQCMVQYAREGSGGRYSRELEELYIEPK